MVKKYNDIHTGDRYGDWMVLDENDFEQKNGYRKYKCQCQCINKTIKYVDDRNLKNGASTCCGKCHFKTIKNGDKFGEWTVLNNKKINCKILCKCSCGKEKMVNVSNLQRGTSTNCGCKICENHFRNNQFTNTGQSIVVGGKYCEWSVLKHIKSQSYLCECSCMYHTQRILSRSKLLNGKRPNCNRCGSMKSRIGEKYGYLTILSIDEERTKEKSRVYVYAKCKCGDVHSYEQSSITKGRVISCGCKKHEINAQNIIGKRFGNLTVVKIIGRKYSNNLDQGCIILECKCDCGNVKNVRQTNLTHGHTWSCGCMKRSHGEELIFKFLNKYKYQFDEQYRIDDCKNILPLPFDFALFSNGKLVGLIEFDGAQHFNPYNFGISKNKELKKIFSEQCIRDDIKTNYCKENKIPLLRITHEDLEECDLYYKLWDFLFGIGLIEKIGNIA